MDQLKQQIIDFAKKNGIDLIGFAEKKRFDGVDPQHNPFSIFPEAKTVILLEEGSAEARFAASRRAPTSAITSSSARTGWRTNFLPFPPTISPILSKVRAGRLRPFSRTPVTLSPPVWR